MDFKTAFEIQNELDNYINGIRGLSAEDIKHKRLLALLTEIGELANETRCFKFWSSKPPSKREIILEELVDCKHFLLSIGNYSGYAFDYDDHNVNINEQIDNDLSELFIGFFLKTSEFYIKPTPGRYIEMWDYFMSIARVLQFSRDEVFNAYLRKNEINYQRQAEGY